VAAADGKKSKYDANCLVGTPLDELLTEINSDIDEQEMATPLYHHHVVFVNSNLWLQGSRERVYILLVRRDLGVEVLKKAVSWHKNELLNDPLHPLSCKREAFQDS